MCIKIIACEVMKEELLSIKPKFDVEYEFVSMDFHLYPEKLKKELQSIIDRSTGYSRVILTFGLCGGATKDLRVTDSILTIPKVHDCIPVLLGSKEIYERVSQEEKGTFYLTCGWMISEKSILSEYKRISEKYGVKKASNVYSRIYGSYKRVLFIHTGCQRENESLAQSNEIANLLNLDHQITKGRIEFIEKIVNGPWDTDDFINIEPFGVILEEDFGIGVSELF